MPVSFIVLAAGMGTRMNSDLPKVLHPIAGAPMLVHAMQAAMVLDPAPKVLHKVAAAPLLHHALTAARSLDPARIVVVTGHGAAEVEAAAKGFDEACDCVLQDPQLGTAHAVSMAAPLLEKMSGDVIVLYGDTPFIRPETLEAILQARARHSVVVLGFQARDPGRYGRLITQGES